MMGKIVLFLFLGISCYLLVDFVFSQNIKQKVSKYIKYKNNKYYEELLKSYEKKKKTKTNSKINLFHQIHILIEQAGIKVTLFLNPITIVLIGMMIFFISYKIVFQIFQMVLLSLLISLPTIFIPIVILSLLAETKNKKIEKVMLNFLLQLKIIQKLIMIFYML